jgi:hypothetical protein
MKKIPIILRCFATNLCTLIALLAVTTTGAYADTFKENASRYIPPGQWWHHLDLEWYEFPSDDPEAIEVWGYTDKLSYAPGEEVSLHVNTGSPTFDVQIFRDGSKLELVHETKGITGQRSPTPKDVYAVGAGWPSLHKWKLPADLRSGFYLVVFSITRGEVKIEQEAGFNVRAAKPTSPMLLMLATSTWRGYNDWGGGSWYGLPGNTAGATGGTLSEISIAPRVHLQRPWARGFMRLPQGAARFAAPAVPVRPKGDMVRYYHSEFAIANGYSKWSLAGGWAAFDRHFVVWAEKNGYKFDFITQGDLHANPDILNDYKVVVTVGHDEYYSWEMRKGLDSWMEQGGLLARMGGNMNWQIRLEDDGLVQVAYKDFARTHDPVRDDPKRKHLLTTMWETPQVNYPAAQTFASSSAFGHLMGLGGTSPRTPGFIVYRPEHWMLKETDLYYGDAFAADYVRFECDGVPYTFRDGRPYPTDEFGTPTNIEIVGLAPTLNREEDHGHSRIIASQGYGDGIPQALYNTEKITEEQRQKHLRGSGILAYMPKGKGGVATAAVNEWVMGLGKDQFVDQITHNILRRVTSD